MKKYKDPPYLIMCVSIIGYIFLGINTESKITEVACILGVVFPVVLNTLKIKF